MAHEVSSHSEMAKARQSDGINVIFDEQSPASSRSRSRSSTCSSRSTSNSSRGRNTQRGRYRSSSSSSSNSRSTSRSSRSRSHPRCYRRSSRCRCSDHRRYQRRNYRQSLPRHYRAHTRSYSRSPSADRYYNQRRYRSRSRSSSYGSRSKYSRVDKYRRQFSRSPPRSFSRQSRSRSSERPIVLSVEEKRQLLEAARQNAMKNLGVQRLELPESIKPILVQQSAASQHGFTDPETCLRRESKHTSQRTEVEEDARSPKLSPKGGISFSINNLVAKPTASVHPCTKVTSLVDSVESKKPYGHWIPVKSARH